MRIGGTVLICGLAVFQLQGCIPHRVDPDAVLAGVRSSNGVEPTIAVVPPWIPSDADAVIALIDTGLAKNPRVIEAQAGVLIALADLGLIDPDLLPKLDLAARTGVRRDDDVNAEPLNRARIQLRASWEIDLWGIGRLKRQARLAALESSVADGRRILCDLTGEIIKALLEIERLDRLIVLIEDEVTALNKQTQETDSRIAQGIIDSMDGDQLHSELDATRAEAVRIKAERSSQHELLVTLLGRGNPMPRLPTGMIDILSHTRPEIPVSACLLRPETKAAEMAVVRDGAEVEAVRRSILPTLSLSADVGRVAASPGSVFSSGVPLWQAGLDATMPVLDAGSYRSRWIRARAGMRRSESVYARAIADGLDRLLRDQNDLKAFTERISSLEQSYASAERFSLKLAERIQTGTMDTLTYLDARRRALAAQRSLIETRYAEAKTLVGLFIDLGVPATADSDRAFDAILLPVR